MAYESQSNSLIEVQVRGKALEEDLKKIVNGCSGRVPYSDCHKDADVQADIIVKTGSTPSLILSITHTKPDTKGHSNENKFQLKLGELVLWKLHHPNLKVVIVVGGKKEEWLPYVLHAFPVFFDDKIYIWNQKDLEKLHDLDSIPLRNVEFWEEERRIRQSHVLSTEMPPNSFLRERFYKEVVSQYMGIKSPLDIKNEIFRQCMQEAYQRFIETNGKSGAEWARLKRGTPEDYDAFWELRSFFNPSEASVMLTLERMGIPYLGTIANDVTLPSMLHNLGMPMMKTKVSEDFVVWSKKYDVPVLIQCKSSGGGMKRHGKNIQNRAKEQIGRGILYRCMIAKDDDARRLTLKSRGKWYKWISILDGNWCMPKSYPLKYAHMLEIAGYDKLLAADSLIDQNCELAYPNPLSKYLEDLDCNIANSEFEEKTRALGIGEEKAYIFQSKKFDTSGEDADAD